MVLAASRLSLIRIFPHRQGVFFKQARLTQRYMLAAERDLLNDVLLVFVTGRGVSKGHA